ncbi:MAG TPA: AraC family transcriptional regulator [Dongiaceae bacterium]|jgi:AraC-like DNA-binding protein
MLGAPPLLTETPTSDPKAPASDLLSDLLRVVRLAGSVFWKADFGAPFAVASTGRTIERLLSNARPRHVTAFHLITHGRCWLDRPGHGRIALSQGDIVMLPFGDYHELGNGDAPIVPTTELVEAQAKEGVITSMRHGGDGESTTIVCGFVQSGDLFFNPVFRSLPRLFVEHTAGEPVTSLLATTVRQLLTEVDLLRPGSREMLGRMMEMLFFEMLRRYAEQLPLGSIGWLGALADPIVGRALQRLHAEPMRSWTVEQLAAEVGTSRSVLADRFKSILGQPPMQYLAGWRLQLATNLLRDGSRSIAEVAGEVGYESEAAFNRAFKRHLGVPPGAWRENLPGAQTLPN